MEASLIDRQSNVLSTLGTRRCAASDTNSAGVIFSMDQKISPVGIEVKNFRVTDAIISAIMPLDRLAAASSPLGPDLIDPEPHYSTSPHDRFAKNYAEVQKTGGARKSKALAGIGRSKKVVWADIPNEPTGTKYISKPYFEKPPADLEDMYRAPIGGWAEMTSQGLYHAAGIGHLHQQVIAASADHGPVIVIRADRVHKRLAASSQWSDDHGRWVVLGTDDDHHKNAARKIVMMDWLSNNHDRNSSNLCLPGPLAIDHGAAFQYMRNGEARSGDDYFEHYAANPEHATHDLDPHHIHDFAGQTAMHRAYGPVLKWWSGVSAPVRQEFARHLDQVRDPKLKDGIRRNFSVRADWLDRMAGGGHVDLGHAWHEDGVALY